MALTYRSVVYTTNRLKKNRNSERGKNRFLKSNYINFAIIQAAE